MKFKKDQKCFLATDNKPDKVTVLQDYDSEIGHPNGLYVYSEIYGHPVYVTSDIVYRTKKAAIARSKLEKKIKDLRNKDTVDYLMIKDKLKEVIWE